MTKTITLELTEAPDYEDRMIYQMVSDMFDVDIQFQDADIEVEGEPNNVAAWIAFHILPMELGDT
jgi:hypothetical protein